MAKAEKASQKKEDKKLDIFKVHATKDRIIVLPRDAEEVSKGGIIIPDTAKEKPNIGKVVNHGPGMYDNGILVPIEAKTGDEIIYGKWAGTPVAVDGVDYLIMRQDDVLAII
jgi:chaperonin GroES